MTLTGSCHCGACGWTLEGDPGLVTACNCSSCRRYGGLWAYDFENERIRLSGPTAVYVRADEPDPGLENRFCPTCANLLAWRGLKLTPDGRRRMGVNLRMADDPEAVADLSVKHLDGAGDWRSSQEGCVRDLWF